MIGPSIEQVAAAIRAVLVGRDEAGRGCGCEARPRSGGRAKTVVAPRNHSHAEADLPFFAGRLLSLNALESLDPTMKTLALTPGTVITPMARDALKRRGVRLTWAAAPRERAGEWGLAIQSKGPRTAVVERRLASESWQPLGSTVDEAAEWVADGVGRNAVVLTDEASVAVWEADRIDGVRAASPTTADAVARAVARLDANLLALEPAAHHPNELIALCSTFRRAAR